MIYCDRERERELDCNALRDGERHLYAMYIKDNGQLGHECVCVCVCGEIKGKLACCQMISLCKLIKRSANKSSEPYISAQKYATKSKRNKRGRKGGERAA